MALAAWERVAVVHDIGTEGDIHFMVQEYLEGQSLRERLDKGALPLDPPVHGIDYRTDDESPRWFELMRCYPWMAGCLFAIYAQRIRKRKWPA